MTGDRGERPEPVEQPGPEPVREPGLPAELRVALAGAPFVADALTTFDLAVDALLDARYAALSAEQVAASVRGLQRALARVDAARLRAVKAVDDRDDVVPGARRDAGASFLRCTLGLDSGDAHRDASAARLLDADTGDLGRLGAAYAAGLIHRGHVDVGVRVHRRLGPEVRARVDGETGQVCIDAVDEVLAAQAQRVSVSVLDRFGRELVDRLNPASPEGAHDRRYLHLGMLPDGSMIGKFACGPVQALALQAAISAGARLRPGRAIDADGVAHDLPDLRSPAQRRMDALADAVAAGLARAGIHLPTSNAPGDARGDGDGGATRGGDHGDGVTTDTGHDDGSTAQPSPEEEPAGPQDEEPAASAAGWDEDPAASAAGWDEPSPAEG
ncbi:MAG: hypothetical protein ACXV3A_04025, partial [Kineosporiaceae bacterium]